MVGIHALASRTHPQPRRAEREADPPFHAGARHAARRRRAWRTAPARFLLEVWKCRVWAVVRKVDGSDAIWLDWRESVLRTFRLPDYRYFAGLQREAALLPALLYQARAAHPARVLRAADFVVVAANVVGCICGIEFCLPGEHDGVLWRQLRLRPLMVTGGGGAFLYRVASGGSPGEHAPACRDFRFHPYCCSSAAEHCLPDRSCRRAGLVYVVCGRWPGDGKPAKRNSSRRDF